MWRRICTVGKHGEKHNNQTLFTCPWKIDPLLHLLLQDDKSDILRRYHKEPGEIPVNLNYSVREFIKSDEYEEVCSDSPIILVMQLNLLKIVDHI
jgi:hypothetical protein